MCTLYTLLLSQWISHETDPRLRGAFIAVWTGASFRQSITNISRLYEQAFITNMRPRV